MDLVRYLGDPCIPIGHVESRGDIAERAAHVGLDQVQQLSRCGRKSPDVKAAIQHQDGDVDSHQKIVQVVGQDVELEIAVQQLLIERVQFFVRGLKLLLGRFQFLICALQLLAARKHLLVGRLHLLLGRFVLADQRT